MLAKSASKQWQEDPEKEIFIERDGNTFRHVLSYLRDGKVVLPLTATKKGLLLELTYYGVEGVDEKDMDDNVIKEFQALSHYEQAHGYLKNVSDSLLERSNILQERSKNLLCAKECIDKTMGRDTRNLGNEWSFVLDKNYSFNSGNISQCDLELNKFGIKIVRHGGDFVTLTRCNKRKLSIESS